MKILYIASKTPFPTTDGGAFASFSFIKQLSSLATLDGIIISTDKHPFTSESSQALSPFFNDLISFSLDTRLKPTSALVSLLKGENYNLKRFKSLALQQQLEHKIRETHYDWIICDSIFAAPSLLQIKSTIKIAIRCHNVEFEIWKKLSTTAKNPLKKWYLNTLAKTLKYEELKLLQKANCVFAITKNDADVFQKMLSNKAIYTLPVVVDSPQEPVSMLESTCFHLGSMDWLPNQEAVQFLYELFTEREELKHINLFLGGRKLTSNQFQATNIVNLGEVANSKDFMKKSGVLVAPIFSGSGVRIKILEALSLGIPVITTPLGASGIDIESSGIVLATTKHEFETHILRLVQNNERRIELGAKGFTYIRNQHSLKQATAILEQVLGK